MNFEIIFQQSKAVEMKIAGIILLGAMACIVQAITVTDMQGTYYIRYDIYTIIPGYT